MTDKLFKKMENILKLDIDFSKIAIRGVVLFFAGVSIGTIIFPNVVKFMIKKQITLKPGTEIREIWSNTPFPLNFYIYVFNVTNPEEVTKGHKPIVEEIGPYYFTLWKDKYDLEDNDQEDSVTFHLRNTFIFRPDRSNGLNGEEMITIPHILLQSIAIVVKRDRPPMLSLVSHAIKEMFPLKMPFLTARFLDIFFRGILVNCMSSEIAVKGVCAAFHTGDIKGSRKFNETHYSFSIFGEGNASDSGKFTVLRGVKNISDLGRVIRFEDEPELDVWNGDECNQLIGTDSTIFPPFLTKEQGLWAYAPELCRSFGAWYDRKSKYGGISTLRYVMDLGNLKADEKLHCFCNDPPDGCPPKGTIDLFPCIGAPLLASLPHFYHGDENLLRNVSGLNPRAEDHEVFIEFYLLSGSPLSAAKRLQFNLDMEPVKEVELMKDLPRVIVPLFWIEESVYLNKTWTKMVKNTLVLGLGVNAFIKWSFMTVGLLVALIAGFFHWKKLQSMSSVAVLEVAPVEQKDENPAKEAPVEGKDNNPATKTPKHFLAPDKF